MIDSSEPDIESVTQWLTDFNQAKSAASDHLAELAELADAFERVGQETVSSEIAHHVMKLRDALYLMNKAVGSHIDEQSRTASRHINEALGAMLDTVGQLGGSGK
jgi:type IV secretory pathway TrbF-like protein